MSSATEKELSELHAKLARQLSRQLEQSDRSAMLLLNHRDELPDEVVRYLEDAVDSVSPALLTAVAKFLKDNDITCLIEENKEMSDLEKRLQEKKQKRKQVGNVLPFNEDE